MVRKCDQGAPIEMETLHTRIVVGVLQIAGSMKAWYEINDFEPIFWNASKILNTQEIPDPRELDFRMFIYECLKLASPVPVHLLSNLIGFSLAKVQENKERSAAIQMRKRLTPGA